MTTLLQHVQLLTGYNNVEELKKFLDILTKRYRKEQLFDSVIMREWERFQDINKT